ncbi:hypothetical protein [Streptomyces sp. me109]|uniref:hypothetical protein n=1 Tax=unclassified Streptomyces TaxID=2593676 RepID=UPI0011CDBDC7|nr:hypothetical protein [Streptomyces sp. me109]TXS54875.1 hypothetical protein EAO69_43105 [Streptomyces sp. me109]
MTLPALDAALLPPTAYACAEDGGPPHRDGFIKVTNLEHGNRPANGLWSAPITSWTDDGLPHSTTWTDWCAAPGDPTGLPHVHHESGKPYSQLFRLEPAAAARIYLIDSTTDLDLLIAAFPLPRSAPMHRTAPNWEALAGARWDAVYASVQGFAANANRFVGHEPSLYGWECASVLWLSDNYRVVPVA